MPDSRSTPRKIVGFSVSLELAAEVKQEAVNEAYPCGSYSRKCGSCTRANGFLRPPMAA